MQDVGPSERWNKLKGEWRSVTETGAMKGNVVERNGGDFRTSGADGRPAGGNGATVTDAIGRTSWTLGGPMEGRNICGDVVTIQGWNWDPARLPLVVRSTPVPVEEDGEGQPEQPEKMGGQGESKMPLARIVLKHIAGNELLSEASNYRNGDKTGKPDAGSF